MTTSRPSRVVSPEGLAAGLVVLSAVLVVLGVVAGLATPDRPSEGAHTWDVISFVAPVAAFSVVGGLIATRHPDSAITHRLVGTLIHSATPLGMPSVSSPHFATVLPAKTIANRRPIATSSQPIALLWLREAGRP